MKLLLLIIAIIVIFSIVGFILRSIFKLIAIAIVIVLILVFVPGVREQVNLIVKSPFVEQLKNSKELNAVEVGKLLKSMNEKQAELWNTIPEEKKKELLNDISKEAKSAWANMTSEEKKETLNQLVKNMK